MKTSVLNERHKKILLIIIALTLCFIWGHSFMSPQSSSEESGFVMELIRPLLRLFIKEEYITMHLVRKLAHFSEYALLGAELSLLFSSILKPVILGLCTALIDEMVIQKLSGRGAALTDVAIDTSGAFAGAVFITLLLYIIMKIKENGKEREKG